MKLNHDCVRDLMLIVERAHIGVTLQLDDLTQIEELKIYSTDTLCYTAILLIDARFVKGKAKVFMHGQDVIIKRLTWEGHKFLDNIRDDGVWTETKAITSKFTSVSLGVISNVATTVVTQLINSHLGL